MKRWILMLLFLVPLLSIGQEFPDKPNQLVSDFAGALSAKERLDLENLVVNYEKETSVQIAIVLMATIDGYPIADYAFELGEKWGVGHANTDNGALVLVSVDERKIWIATGYGLEGSLPDALVKRIIQNEITPQFKGGRYYHGLKAGAEAMIMATKGEYDGQGKGDTESSNNPIPLVLLIGVIWVIVMITKVFQVRRYAGMNSLSFWAAWMLLNSSRRRHGGSWSSFSGGRGGFSGGGGFGGFGGGSFGGGGAGGSW